MWSGPERSSSYTRRRVRAAPAALLLLLAGTLGAAGPAPAPVTPSELSAHLRFLASDLLEGRGPGTRGDRLTQEYLETQMRLAGLAPAFGGSYRQPVPLRIVSPDPGMTLHARPTGGGSAAVSLGTFGSDFVGMAPKPEGAGQHETELVFAGFGIVSPRFGWDDFEGTSVKGKVLVLLAGEPGSADPAFFDGPALTLEGRWRTKLELAARLGAAGVLLVHSRSGAGYGWEVVRNSWSRPVAFDPSGPGLLDVEGWITEAAAERMLAAAGRELAPLAAAAARPGFRPVPLGLAIRWSAANRYEETASANVAGVVRGRPGPGPRRTVVVTAHHDHLGLGAPERGDAIYNGAMDNGSALAVFLGLVRLFGARAGELPADVLFLAPAAEESGLLGSELFVRNPSVPLASIVACVNLEMATVWGESRDLVAIGAKDSDLADVVGKVARAEGLALAPDPAPEQGFFFRSDQLSFARGGVPALWLDMGDDLAGKPAGTGLALREAYRRDRYHRPADAFDPSWELTGTAQLARVAARLVDEIAAREGALAWKPGAPYHR